MLVLIALLSTRVPALTSAYNPSSRGPKLPWYLSQSTGSVSELSQSESHRMFSLIGCFLYLRFTKIVMWSTSALFLVITSPIHFTLSVDKRWSHFHSKQALLMLRIFLHVF